MRTGKSGALKMKGILFRTMKFVSSKNVYLGMLKIKLFFREIVAIKRSTFIISILVKCDVRTLRFDNMRHPIRDLAKVLEAKPNSQEL